MVFILFFSAKVNAQKKNVSPFNEFGISINHTAFTNPNILNKTGFGVGIYHQSNNEGILKAKFGIEYNLTNIFKKEGEFGHFYHTTNVTHNFNTFSLPVLINTNFGRKKIFFIESGLYTEITFLEKIKGTLHTYLPYKPNTKTTFTKEEAGLFDYGISFGSGYRAKVLKYQIIVKPEFKYGLSFLNKNSSRFSQKYIRIMANIRI